MGGAINNTPIKPANNGVSLCIVKVNTKNKHSHIIHFVLNCFPKVVLVCACLRSLTTKDNEAKFGNLFLMTNVPLHPSKGVFFVILVD